LSVFSQATFIIATKIVAKTSLVLTDLNMGLTSFDEVLNKTTSATTTNRGGRIYDE
jgi:hypothetical protein